MDNLIIAQCGIWHIHGILDNKKKQMADTATGMNESQNCTLNEKRQITQREGHRDTETHREKRNIRKEVRNRLFLRVRGGSGFEKDMGEFSGNDISNSPFSSN